MPVLAEVSETEVSSTLRKSTSTVDPHSLQSTEKSHAFGASESTATTIYCAHNPNLGASQLAHAPAGRAVIDRRPPVLPKIPIGRHPSIVRQHRLAMRRAVEACHEELTDTVEAVRAAGVRAPAAQ